MKSLISLILLLLAMSQCTDEALHRCATKATVRDLSGLDGCGFVFELPDGTRLKPAIVGYCGTPPLPKEVIQDPLFDFEFVDGKEVFISYEPVASASICMVGPTVKITCLTVISSPQEQSEL